MAAGGFCYRPVVGFWGRGLFRGGFWGTAAELGEVLNDAHQPGLY